MSRIPPPDQTGHILSHLDGGIEAAFSRWEWLGRSISYSDQTGRTCYINRSSAVEFLQKHGAAVGWTSRAQEILKEIEKLCPISKAEKRALAKLGAIVRGHQVRSHTVLPSRVRQFLEKRFTSSPSDDDSSQMAILICRQINGKLAKRSNAGKSFLITSLKGHARLDYPEDESEKVKQSAPIRLEVDLWMTLSEDGKGVSLQFKPKDALFLGKGGYREVFAAEEISLDMQPTKDKQGYSRKTTKTPSVRVSGVDDQLLPSSSGYKRVERGAKVHKTAFLRLTEAKKKGLFQEVHLATPHEELGVGAAKQVRYGADMEKLLKKGTMAQDFSLEAKDVPIPRLQLLQCARDVTLALKWLNAQEIIHRDVKLGNVNVSWGKDGKGVQRPLAYLADFDFAKQGFGYDPLAFEYDYYVWDPCSSANIATPYTDLYGAAMVFCDAMAPTIGWKWFDEAKKAIQLTVERREPFQSKQYLPEGLDEHQKKAFAAFCDICYESSLLLEELKKKRGFPESIGPEQVKTAMKLLQKKGLLQYTLDSLIGLIDREIKRAS